MVNLKPSEIAGDKPVSEHVIFQAMQGITDKPNWIALHSLKQNVVKQGLEAETDFIVFIPGKGIVFVEAKGATSATAVGTEWTMEGVPPKAKKKNPFEQIDNARRNIRGQLTKLGYQVDDIPIARLVWFTKISPFQVDSSRGMAFSHWELAYQEDLSRPAKALEKVLNEEIQSKQGNPTVNYKPKTLTEGLSLDITNSLLGRLAANSTPENLAVERSLLVRKATDEQLLLLSLIENNNHVYFEGEAGTGKTELLSRSAVDMARDRKVLYTCYNVMLAEQIQKVIGAHSNIDVLDLNKVLLRIAGKKANPKNAGTDWYERELPELALDVALKRGPGLPRYEAICFDEFQDIASRPIAFDAITLLLKKDHRPAKVMMAGDDEQQIMASGMPVPSFAFAKKAFPNLVHISLKTNCRQAPGLSKAIHKLLGWPQNHLSHRLPGSSDWGLEVIATTPEKEAKDLYKVLVRLQKTIAPENIRVLSPFGENNSVLAKLLKDNDTHSSELRSLKKLFRHESAEEEKRWRSIPKYKGLESDVVVITDVSKSTKDWLAANEKFLSNQLYVGMTRAKFQVVLLVSDGIYRATHFVDGTSAN